MRGKRPRIANTVSKEGKEVGGLTLLTRRLSVERKAAVITQSSKRMHTWVAGTE